MEYPQRDMEIPHETISKKIRPNWVHDVVQGAKIYGAPEGSKRLRTHPSYVALMCNLVDVEPTYFEDATKKKEWMDAILKDTNRS